VRHRAQDSVGAALLAARSIAATNEVGARALTAAANVAFFDAFTIGCTVAAAVALAGAVFAAVALPAGPTEPVDPAPTTM